MAATPQSVLAAVQAASDALTAYVAQADAQVVTLTASLATVTAERDALRAQLATAKADAALNVAASTKVLKDLGG